MRHYKGYFFLRWNVDDAFVVLYFFNMHRYRIYSSGQLDVFQTFLRTIFRIMILSFYFDEYCLHYITIETLYVYHTSTWPSPRMTPLSISVTKIERYSQKNFNNALRNWANSSRSNVSWYECSDVFFWALQTKRPYKAES